ncbi:peptidase C39 family protein [Deinococcus hopiensis]|uniref:Peptidase_C39 like family protein n=1 Tax=Deinococcus hopiensis KR-140 TaxID=695939 RepID=A0A1W1VBV2_9DEIO|nr:peptidase C39 family protein [Deinococcus hopiensis]SMB90454.1 Peptidase_C39 like family protein [Deinococcus hopiensis KR-140]
MRAALLTALSLLGPSLQGGAEALTMTYPHSSTLIHERAEDWAGAARQGVELRGDTLRLSPERSAGTLTSLPLTAPAFDELVPSWNAVTPGAGSVGVEVRVREGQHGGWSRWFSFGTWRSGEGRTSLNGQRDASGQVLTDTLRLGQKMKTYQYRVTLRGAGTELRLLALNTAERAARAAGLGQPGNPLNWGKVMNVPLRSQMLYPGGGEVWCSPTSVSMILAHHGVKVTVPQAAQGTFDRAYEGTGNWPFNTAYAASFGLRAFVTRLPSLAEAERYTAAGFPLAVSLGWKKGELPGVPLPVSEGHLMVLVGFDTEGNPVLNDPAAPTDAAVRRTYTRLAFERQWLTHSGGLSYVIAPQGARLP